MLLIGYAITLATVTSFLLLISLVIYDRRELYEFIGSNISLFELAVLCGVLVFFIAFSILYVTPTEQLYFDENIYQGIALNVLSHGNALWCQYGTGYVKQCFNNILYHDPVVWSVFLALGFALFGIGTGTAYALSLFMGALSIVGVFLFASSVFGKRGAGAAAALIFALMPQLFIWSRAQATIDLPFMTFTIFAFFFFVAFIKRMNIRNFALFSSCLVITLYSRIEAMLLVPVFIVLYLTYGDKGVRKTFAERFRKTMKELDRNLTLLIAVLFFFALIVPQIYYIAVQFQSGDYGQGSGQQLLSVSNFVKNAPVNLWFLLGRYNTLPFYPDPFPWPITLLAVIGAMTLALDTRIRNRHSLLLVLGLWFAAYFLFYGFFYAGAATYGVDVRFMLQLIPAMAVLATVGAYELSGLVALAARRQGLRPIAYAVAIAVFALVPFLILSPLVTLPLKQMPQQSIISGATSFIYSNYNKVPSNCLVFSFTPDIWYGLNRSASQIGYLGGKGYNFTRFSCLVLDYGYWCVVPPYKDTTCKNSLSSYHLKPIVTESSGNGANFTLYQILNYS